MRPARNSSGLRRVGPALNQASCNVSWRSGPRCWSTNPPQHLTPATPCRAASRFKSLIHRQNYWPGHVVLLLQDGPARPRGSPPMTASRPCSLRGQLYSRTDPDPDCRSGNGCVVLFFCNFLSPANGGWTRQFEGRFGFTEKPRDGPTSAVPARDGWRAIQKSPRVTRAFRHTPKPQERHRIMLCACDVRSGRRPALQVTAW